MTPERITPERLEEIKSYQNEPPNDITAECLAECVLEIERLQAEVERLKGRDSQKLECSICKGSGFLDVEKYDRVEQADCKWCGTTGIEPQPQEALAEIERLQAEVERLQADNARLTDIELEKVLFPNLEVESIDPMVRQYIAGMKEIRDKLIRSHAEVERLKAANARLSAAFQETASVYGFAHSADCQRSLNDLLAPTIEVLEAVERCLLLRGGHGEPFNSVVKELARLKAIVEGGK